MSTSPSLLAIGRTDWASLNHSTSYSIHIAIFALFLVKMLAPSIPTVLSMAQWWAAITHVHKNRLCTTNTHPQVCTVMYYCNARLGNVSCSIIVSTSIYCTAPVLYKPIPELTHVHTVLYNLTLHSVTPTQLKSKRQMNNATADAQSISFVVLSSYCGIL